MAELKIDEENRKAVDLLRKLDAEWYRTIVLMGWVGVWKTFLAENIVRHDYMIDESAFKQHIVSSTAVMMPANAERNRTNLKLYPLEALAKFPSVIYDDMGSADLTAAMSEKTLYWLNERLKSTDKRTVVTTNLTIDELKEREGRIYSRLCQDAVFVAMGGSDRRQKSAKFVQV